MASTTPQKSSGVPANGQSKAITRQEPRELSPLAKKQKELGALISSRRDAFALVAGKHFNPDRLVKLAHGALARQPALAECTGASILVALMRCAELDLEPDSALPQNRMWLVPRNNKKTGQKECTYIIDYRAQLQLARQTELVASVIATEVRQNDRFTLHYDAEGTSITKFEFEPGGEGGVFAKRGEVIGYFAAARLEGGEVQLAAMSTQDAEAFRDRRAPTYNGKVVGPWKDDFDAMAIKTCLRKLWNLLPAGKSEAAREAQKQFEREGQIADGATVQATAPVELDLGVPVEQLEATSDQVEKALGAGPATPETPPADDVQFETAAEQKAREEAEAKRNAAELTNAVGRAAERAREPGDDDGDEFAQR